MTTGPASPAACPAVLPFDLMTCAESPVQARACGE